MTFQNLLCIAPLPHRIISVNLVWNIIGTSDFQLNVIEKLCVAPEFGTENTGAVTYIGMTVKQHPDKSITLYQVTFASSISPTELPQDRLASKGASLTQEECTQF